MLQSFRLALRSLAGSKLRSFLTMLGIIIGVAAVILLVSLMSGMTSYISDSFSDLGTNQISVSVTNTESRSVEPEDLYEVLDENGSLLYELSPTVSAMGSVRRGSETLRTTSVTGVSEGYAEISSLGVSSGRFISYSDIVSEQKVCVIGSYVSLALFDGEDPLGQTIKLNGEPYTVVGVLAEKAGSEEGSSDDAIYLPYTSAAKLSMSSDITSYIFTVDSDRIEQAQAVIESALYEIFLSEDFYTVTTLSEMLETVESITGMMTALLVGIAAISLLVAGIGIMNIQLVSVSERTREIGIRKSLGARQRVILRQFIIEAGLQSSIGGLLGIALGSGLTVIASSLIGFDAPPSMTAILLSFLVSAGIGVLFGYMPARRAARLNPIDALRSE